MTIKNLRVRIHWIFLLAIYMVNDASIPLDKQSTLAQKAASGHIVNTSETQDHEIRAEQIRKNLEEFLRKKQLDGKQSDTPPKHRSLVASSSLPCQQSEKNKKSCCIIS